LAAASAQSRATSAGNKSAQSRATSAGNTYAQPKSGTYRVPDKKQVVTKTKAKDAQAKSDERMRKLIAENAAKQKRSELEQRYARTTGLLVNPNQSSYELRQVLDDPSSIFNMTE
jgi:hypothetical protein